MNIRAKLFRARAIFTFDKFQGLLKRSKIFDHFYFMMRAGLIDALNMRRAALFLGRSFHISAYIISAAFHCRGD